MKHKFFNVVFILMMMFFISSCSSKQKEENDELLNIDTIIDNGNCMLSKQSENKNDLVTNVYFDDNLVSIEYCKNKQIMYEKEYYFYKNNNIYHATTQYDYYSLTTIIDTNKYGIGTSFYKFKKLLQLSFIYVNLFDDGLLIDNLYNTIINDLNITKTFNSNLSFYENVRNYYNSIFPEFNNNLNTYSVDSTDILLSNGKLLLLSKTNDNIYRKVIRGDLMDYKKIDLNDFNVYECDSYIDKFKKVAEEISYNTSYDRLPLLINKKYSTKGKVRKIQATIYDENTNENESVIITEYSSKNACNKAYNAFMKYYLPGELYFAKKNNILYITNASNDDSIFKNILDVEFKNSNKYNNIDQNKDILSSLVIDFSLDYKYYNNDFSAGIINSYAKYIELIQKIKKNNPIYYSTIKSKIDSVRSSDFYEYQYVLVQAKIMPYQYGNKYEHSVHISHLDGNTLDIALTQDGIAAEYAVADNACSYQLFKIKKDINIINFEVNPNRINLIGSYMSTEPIGSKLIFD